MISSVQELIQDFKQGKFIILVDDEDRENEGDLVLAADFVTEEAVNFLAKEARGLICLTLTAEKIQELELPMMRSEKHRSGPTETAFTYSIEASSGITTGISAADRAHTIKVASRSNSTAKDVIVPGHVFPLKANSKGVLGRQGHTEASVDYAQLAGLTPAAVICELINDDGTMSRLPQLLEFSRKFGIKIGTIADLVQYRKEHG